MAICIGTASSYSECLNARPQKAPIALAAVALTSQATIITGDTVNVTHYFPNASSVDANLGNQVVPTANFNYGGINDVVVGTDYMTLNAYCGEGCSWAPASFNGAVLWDLTNNPFVGVSIDASSSYAGFDASRLSFDANHVYLNLQGLSANGFLRVNFDGNEVPEPDSLVLIGLGLVGLAAVRRKAKTV